MTYWLRRAMLILATAGLVGLLASLSASGEDVRRDSVAVMPGMVAPLTYYLHGNSVRFLVEVVPSRARVNIVVVSGEGLRRLALGLSARPVRELRRVSEADFRVSGTVGLHVVLVENVSDVPVTVHVTRVSRGVQPGPLYGSLAATVTGLVGLLALRILRARASGSADGAPAQGAQVSA